MSAAAVELGLAVVAAGSVPLVDRRVQEVVGGERNRRMLDD